MYKTMNYTSDDRKNSVSRLMNQIVTIVLTLSLSAGIVLVTPGRASAAASQLDQTFGSGGKVFYVTVSGSGGSGDVEIQPDGKAVVVGMSGFEVARFNVDGTHDDTFDSDGLAQVPGLGQANALAIQADGKIVVGGSSGGDLALARFNSDGSLDTTFDGDGIATLVQPDSQEIVDIAIQPDGKIVVGGNTGPSFFIQDFMIVRFNANGSPDASFGPTGIGVIQTSFNGPDSLSSIVLQSDGKIVAGGYTSGTSEDFALIRLTANGPLDTTFDTDGKLTTSIQVTDFLNKVLIQPDGKIIATGSSRASQQSPDATVVRYNPSGSLDTTFDGDGIATANDGAFDETYAAALQSDGKIIITERRDFNSSALIRFNANGSLDTSFHGDGKFVFPASSHANTSARAVAVGPDGKIIISGQQGPDVFLSRLLGDPRRVVTNNTGIVLEDRNGTNPPFLNNSTVNVSGLPGTITKVRVSLNKITHTFPADLDIMLEGPTGARTMLMSDTGGGNAQGFVNKTLIIDQSAATAIPIPTTENLGYFKPTNIAGPPALEPGGIDVFPPPGPGSNNYGAGNLDVFNGTNPNGQWKLYAVDDEAQDFGGFDGWTLDVTTTTSRLNNQTADFDGDGRADMSVFRPSNGGWYLNRSNAGFLGRVFGVGTDLMTPADYDGDGKTDVAVFRPSNGFWYIENSSDGTVSYVSFGLPEDLPAPADYDGDGRADICVFRPSTGTWYRQNSSNGSFFGLQFGSPGDRPTVGDFDGDGIADIGIWRPSNGDWYHIRSSEGTFFGERFGLTGDKIVPADYDGDGKTDIAIYRPSASLWYVRNSATATYTPFVFGLATDIPVPGDYEGDGKADIAVFRPSDGTWYIRRSSDSGFTIFPWGQNGDRPVPNAFSN